MDISPQVWYFIVGGLASFATLLTFLLAFWKVITRDKVRNIIKLEIQDFMNKDFESLKRKTFQNSDEIKDNKDRQVTNTHNIELLDSNVKNLEKIVNNHYELHTKSFDKLDTRLQSIDNQLRLFLSSIKINTE